MGSSPFTATTPGSSGSPRRGSEARLQSILDAFFSSEVPLEPGQRLLVAFSGGPDSMALLAGLQELSLARGFEVHAGHVDHGLDADSSRRAQSARRISRHLGVPFHLLSPEERPEAEESIEAAARGIRYRSLEELRRALAARYVVTAHHRDDQAETVLLRIAFGSGLSGLEGIRPVRGRRLRPLLAVSRREVLEALRERDLPFVEDPTNRDLSRPRNLLRHRVLPVLERDAAGLRERLAALATASGKARHSWEERLFGLLAPRRDEGAWGIPIDKLLDLPEEVRSLGLDLLHRLSGSPYPPTAGARRELWRQIHEEDRLGVDCGAHLRWERRGKLLVVASHATPTPFFSYTLQVPGEVQIAELGMSFRLSPVTGPVPPRVPRSPSGDPIAPGPLGPVSGIIARALFSKEVSAGETVTVRNRRPGDCMSPPGARYPRRLKQLLTNRKVPFRRRDRLPLTCVRGVIIWIPGLGVDDRFHPGPAGPSWLAEISAHEH